ncbi:hypothetical protein GGR56DRAFT_351060 [Xylariaceae sp. FL0804]|nr:hypothetical protein GGR56DRAFT_351060 [Xylariaceae sp. FL0804]
MSGSPPLPPKPNSEVAERGHGGFLPPGQDVYRAGSMMPGSDYRSAPPQPPLPPPPPAGVRPFPLEAPERYPYSYHRPEETMGRPLSYPGPGRMMSQPHYPLPPTAGPSMGPAPYPLTSNPQGLENPPYTSPKSQRKTKGHVASACVPCKRAHLRCDAQRPCSRCLSNGKEDACIDVVHKKRGRPRLREDREPRFDAPPRFAHAADPPLRRPVSLYAPASGPAATFDNPLRGRPQRVLKSQPSDPIPPRYLERASAADANIFPPPLSIPARAQEPVAFLTTELEVAKASSTFCDAVGRHSVTGQKLSDAIAPSERDRVLALQRALHEEQGRKDPNHLPPIFIKQETEKVMQTLTFSPEFISRYQLDRQDFFTFVAADGQARPHAIRIGLVKEGSIYIVVLLLLPTTQPFTHPTPSPHARDLSRELSYSFQPQAFAQLTPVSASFDPGRPRYGDPPREAGYTPRPPGTPAHIMSGYSPGISPNAPSYAPSATARPEHPSGPAHHIPRSELPPTRPPQQPENQLPPIRSRPPPAAETGWQREDRTGRVDIGGLIEKPGPPHQRH